MTKARKVKSSPSRPELSETLIKLLNRAMSALETAGGKYPNDLTKDEYKMTAFEIRQILKDPRDV